MQQAGVDASEVAKVASDKLLADCTLYSVNVNL